MVTRVSRAGEDRKEADPGTRVRTLIPRHFRQDDGYLIKDINIAQNHMKQSENFWTHIFQVGITL